MKFDWLTEKCLWGLLLLLIGTSMWGFLLTRYGSADFDEPLLLWFRHGGDPGQLAGPEWVSAVWHGLSWLGDTTPRLTMTGLIITGLLLSRRWRSALLVLGILSSGIVLSTALKNWIQRPRPRLVPYLDHVNSFSFPSGHALNSTLFYLVIALLLTYFLKQCSARLRWCFVMGGMLLATGVSRVALGVHYPSDVIAGWIIGIAWFGLWVAVARLYWPKSLP